MTDENRSNRLGAYISISIFVIFATVLSVIPYYAIVKFNPASIYIGALMWTPAIAAFLALKITGRTISSMPWRWGKTRYPLSAYLTPILYVSIAYGFGWALGFGDIVNGETVLNWARELGLEGKATIIILIVMIFLLGTIGFLTAAVTIFGEEIGWRGFLILELRKVLPFGAATIICGLVWSLWHWPIVLYYGGGEFIIQMTTFTITLVNMSVIMAYFTFKSQSIWPAVIFHAAHNTYIQSVVNPITTRNEQTSLWLDEFGIMLPIITTLFALYFWLAAKKEGL